MTQDAKTGIPTGKIALGLAALAAAFAVGFAISRDGGHDAAMPAPPSSTSPALPQSIEALERQTADSPGNPLGWQALGLAYFGEGRFADAVRAYEKATALDGQKAILWSALGEARVMASKTDPMPKEAAADFERAIAIDAKDPRARYFLAVKKDLGGDHAGAVDDWIALLQDSPADAPWRGDLVRTIEQVGKINRIDVAPRIAAADRNAPAPVMPIAARGIPGPTAQDLAAASKIPPGEQRGMAEGMVSRLEARLKGNPRNIEGWVMLMRSRVTLGEPDKASQALRDAIAANPGEAGVLRDQASMLGVR